MKIRRFINQHFEKAKQRGYIPMFAAAAQQYDFPIALLMAIASRETNMTNMLGDFRGGKYHGHGIMQVDIGTAPEWCASGAWRDVRQSIMKGTGILAQKRVQLNREWPKGRQRTLREFLWVLAASYNQGAALKGGALGDFLTYGTPDRTTTGGDYGADVLGRMVEFQALLDGLPEGQKMPLDAPHLAVAERASESGLPAPKGQPEGQPQPDSGQNTGQPQVVAENIERVETQAPQVPVAGGGAGDAGTSVKKEKPGWLARALGIWGTITGTLAIYNLDPRSILAAVRDNQLTGAQVVVIFAVVLLILGFTGMCIWFWDRSATRAQQRTMAKINAATDKGSINVQIT